MNKELYEKVEEEIERAIKLHGLQQDISLEKQFVILSEEIGEVAKDILENNLDNVEVEIVQSIAMLVKLYKLVSLKKRELNGGF